MDKKYIEEQDFHLDELTKARKEYFEADQGLHNYWEQFLYTIKDGAMIEPKPYNVEEYKKIEKMEKEVEEKRQKYIKAKGNWQSFLSRRLKFF